MDPSSASGALATCDLSGLPKSGHNGSRTGARDLAGGGGDRAALQHAASVSKAPGDAQACAIQDLATREVVTPPRVLLVASGGGHWIELCRLSAAFAGYDCQFACTSSGVKAPVGTREVLLLPDGSRDSAWAIARAFFRLLGIVRRFRPELVISTGAAPGAVALFAGKLFGVRTIWIDSIANRESLSLSGRLVRPVADLRLTQSDRLATRSGSVQYFGKVL